MKHWLFIVVLLGQVVSIVHAQTEGTLTYADSDPMAIELLENMNMSLREMDGFSAQFTMSLMAPGSDTLRYSGTLDQSGNKYHVDVTDYRIISNGKSRWVYHRAANEANLYDEGESEDSSSPLAYLALYESGDFVIRLADEYASEGQRCVELKPLDRMSEYIKVRLSLNSSTKAPARIEVFEKGGTKTDLIIDKINTPVSFPEEHFVFRQEDYPGVHVEDLRID